MSRPQTAAPPTLSPSIHALVELFAGPLKEVAFPGVDGPVLQALVADLQRSSEAVDAAAAALRSAEAQLAEHRDALLAKTQLGIAYARVYAQGHAELLAEIDRIALPKSALPKPPLPKRGPSPERLVDRIGEAADRIGADGIGEADPPPAARRRRRQEQVVVAQPVAEAAAAE